LTAPLVVVACHLAIGMLRHCRGQTALGVARRVGYLRVHTFKIHYGGTLAHAAGVVAGFRQNGWDVDVLTTDELPLRQPTVQVPLIGWWRNFPEVQEMAHNGKLFWRGWRHFRSNPPSLIYQRHGGFIFAGLALARLLGVPCVIEYNSSDAKRAQLWKERRFTFGGLLRRVEQLHLTRADVVSVVSSVLAEQAAASYPECKNRRLINPNGVDPQKFRPDIDGAAVRHRLKIPAGRIVVGFSGTFMPYQGLETLANSIRWLAANGRLGGFHFVVLGDGGMRPGLEQMLDGIECRDHVSFPGAVPFAEVESYLAAGDILVSPHALPPGKDVDFYWSPIKLFEYMAMGKAIVASRLGQMAEVLEDGVDALLVTAGDEPALAKAILRLAEDAGLRTRLGQAARAKVLARYTWRHNVARLLAPVAGAGESGS
jgi:glycosyltransferase involved in cell wall biosynthesis